MYIYFLTQGYFVFKALFFGQIEFLKNGVNGILVEEDISASEFSHEMNNLIKMKKFFKSSPMFVNNLSTQWAANNLLSAIKQAYENNFNKRICRKNRRR